MSVYLYRLFAVQTFKQEKVAVYVFDGNYPTDQVLSDAESIVAGEYTRREVLEYNDYIYGLKEVYPNHGPSKRNVLTYYTRMLKRSQNVIAENENVTKAIFVPSTNKKEWRGEVTLYDNKIFESYKSDTLEYSGCTPTGTIII